MATRRVSAPTLGDPVRPARRSPETLELLATRRSTLAKTLAEPGPSEGELEQILEIGARVPDHRRLAPWRFVVIRGRAREALHARLETIYAETQEAASEEARAKAMDKLASVARVPVTICVVSAIRTDTEPARRTPAWEQELSAGAACQNLLVAACASGYAAQWVTEWYAYEPRVQRALGLGTDERIAGFVFVGTATQEPLERQRRPLSELVRHWSGNVAP